MREITHVTTFDKVPVVGSLAIGGFDGLHIGHLHVINGGGCDSVLTFSGQRSRGLVMGRAERLLVIKSATNIHTHIEIPFADIRGLTPEEFLSLLKCAVNPHRLAVGQNFRFGRQAAGDISLLKALCDDNDIELYIAPYAMYSGRPVSSTRIRNTVAAGDMSAAAAMLGRPFFAMLPVDCGDRRGRNLGFRTINQILPPERILPKFGVYGSRVTLNGTEYRAVTNVGVRPTFGEAMSNMETHILDFDGELYGETVLVELLEYYRGERRFPSPEALKIQIAEDVRRRMEQ